MPTPTSKRVIPYAVFRFMDQIDKQELLGAIRGQGDFNENAFNCYLKFFICDVVVSSLLQKVYHRLLF